MRATILKIGFILLLPLCAFGQTDIATKEQTLVALFDSLKASEDDLEKQTISQKIETDLMEILQLPESFNYPFDKLKYMGKVTSDDEKARFYTWLYPLNDKTFGYGGLIQYKTSKKELTATRLVTKRKARVPGTGQRIPAGDWYGALYYKAIHVSKGDYYILLGWGGNNAASSYKLIEPVDFDKKGRPNFGKTVLKPKGRTQHRFILEYSSDAKVNLNYEAKQKRIVFDHLVPSEPIYNKIYSYYGPDFTYDAFELKKGKWTMVENIDAKNDK
ncbi:MAG: hypothetical protein J6Y37_06490 [Paludibacteraceae bacterium]|nr:hypothetical protein [Paludibacteraceae bacterium]